MTTGHILQVSLTAAEERLRAKAEIITALRSHLHTPKFQGEDANGDRKDWITVDNVLEWLTVIAAAGG